MESSRIFLGKVGEWLYSEYYFDKENDCFIEERYHHEYLDTGTVFEGSNVVSAQQVYMAFIEEMNTKGIDALLTYCDNLQPATVHENQITEQEFYEKLKELDHSLWWKLRKIDSTYIFTNQQGHIIGVLSKTEHFFAYVDLYKKAKGFASKNEAFAYIIDCLSERYQSEKGSPVVNGSPAKQQTKKTQKKSCGLKNIFKKT